MIQGGYTKLYSSIIGSSIWGESKQTKILWVTLLALSDKDGYVAASIPGLARLAFLSIEETEKALQKLQEPDPYSRTPEHEGRRIEAIEGGWVILNRVKYRDLGREEAKAQAHREANRKYYQAKKQQDSNLNSDNSDVRISESDGVGDKEKKKDLGKVLNSKSKPLRSQSERGAVSSSESPKESKTPDPRHATTRDLIRTLYREKFGQEVQWDASEGKQLGRLLTVNPSWTQAQLEAMVRARFVSEIDGERPRVWLPHLSRYAGGPLDRFGKPKRDSAPGQSHGGLGCCRRWSMIERCKQHGTSVGDPESVYRPKVYVVGSWVGLFGCPQCDEEYKHISLSSSLPFLSLPQ